MTESVPINTPLADLDMEPDVAVYVGLLEGTIATQVITINKFRALLELLTGDKWDDVKLDPNGEKLKEISINSLVKQTGMSKAQAAILVQRRWNEHNEPEANRSPENDFSSAPPTPDRPMSERARLWREKQLAAARNQPQSATTGFIPVSASNDQVAQGVSVDARE